MKKLYKALRGSNIDNVWSPDGRHFVTVQCYRSAWGVFRPTWIEQDRLKANIRFQGHRFVRLLAMWRAVRMTIHWNMRLVVIWSVIRSWVMPVLFPIHLGWVHEYKPPFRKGRGVSIWLWGRTHVIIGRWSESDYDPEAELQEILHQGTKAVEDLGLDTI